MAAIVLRVAVFGTFLGHGLLAIMMNPNWVPYLLVVGFSESTALQLMPIIGSMDMLVAFITLIKPNRYVLIYAIIWAFMTALIRPVAGESLLAFVERAANWAAPLALYILLYTKKK